jgi:hypothetical protein
MPYEPDDPRVALPSPTSSAGNTLGVPRPAQARELWRTAPDEQHRHGSGTWWTRSQSMTVAVTAAEAGEELVLDHAAAEYVVLVLDGAQVAIEHEVGGATVTEPSVAVMPAGGSSLTVQAPGTVVRLFVAHFEPRLAAGCANSAGYLDPDPNVAAFRAWPAPSAGPALRVYRLDDFPCESGRLGRIFRCSTLMVNVLPEDGAPRDPTKLSPHHHDDFEQISLQLHGDYVHHLRVPWTPDSSAWRDDEHVSCRAPAVMVIPPGLVHTSQSLGEMRHWLIDVFAPPRFDFSGRPGWVLNAGEYPTPD